MSDEPDLWDAQEDLERVVRYFEEVEERLGAQGGAPVHLVETESAQRAANVITGLLEADRERGRAWKREGPGELGQDFADLVAAFVSEKGISWEELAERLHLEPRSFAHLSAYVRQA